MPALPVTLDELVATAKECEAVGASVIHVHIRDDDAQPTLDLGRLRDTVAALRAEHRPDRPALQRRRGDRPGGATGCAVLDAAPDMASCTMGTVNFGDDVFLNRWEFIVELHTRMRDRGIVPEYEIFDLGHLTSAGAAARQARPAGRRPRARRLRDGRARAACRARPRRSSPASTRCATCPRAPRSRPPASAARTLPVLLASLAAGGHLRVGMEDTVTYAQGPAGREQRPAGGARRRRSPGSPSARR